MGGTEQEYVKDAFDTNWIAPLGPHVTGFEKDIQAYLEQGSHVAVLSSGTAALHLGLQLLGVGRGDEVLCQSLTFSASANPIVYLGATPIFIDSEEETWNISPELMEAAIQDRIKRGKKPKAIVAVHLYGMPYKVKEVHEIAAKYNIPILEDSAEALGSSYDGIKCGTFGDIAVLSFNGNKIITTSGGGAMVSKNKGYIEKSIHLATQARDKAVHYQHSDIGYNYRMSNVLAGIGRGQMEVLDERVTARRSNYHFYYQELNSISEIEFLNEPEGSFSNRWLSCVMTPSYDIREQIRLSLLEEDIESRPLWKPMHLQPVFNACPNYSDGTSEDLFNRGLCLPSGSNLSTNDLERITSIIKKTLL
ncbi:aminotransferase class I/II-fold pyridoxal phosphate-dependent enzyme [Arenibacter palladensis]|uniref:aminotransferase class I/II-fold pyridoxal phosphate-dependent enzyme n=1 Tax=Arenibacter palladensis TaxID=237373 RepID=UPI0026E2FF57|nr:aminotransferase class I/II-fold pyridoxal phosphate-dependent enzyme [Arenibacter palladensis]MDO6605148.1 aminotransferase class I/II-fold pyridoxal phosphate-dependent enzyme [Arenibacter palladensis]